tara:strand:+ start:475 stop:720 length:246 start_codon:yes stop_codon:yes gene_type:complete
VDDRAVHVWGANAEDVRDRIANAVPPELHPNRFHFVMDELAMDDDMSSSSSSGWSSESYDSGSDSESFDSSSAESYDSSAA